MIERVVLDRARDPEGIAARLGQLSPSPAVAMAGDGAGTLWVTESADKARTAIERGSMAWVVGPTGELQAWDDLPLALALGGGTLGDVRRLVDEHLRARHLKLDELAWAPDGSAVGKADGEPVLVTAGPDGEDPQVFVGGDAETMARERGTFLESLQGSGQVASGGSLAPGQTHTLSASDSRRPRLERRRFSYIDQG